MTIPDGGDRACRARSGSRRARRARDLRPRQRLEPAQPAQPGGRAHLNAAGLRDPPVRPSHRARGARPRQRLRHRAAHAPPARRRAGGSDGRRELSGLPVGLLRRLDRRRGGAARRGRAPEAIVRASSREVGGPTSPAGPAPRCTAPTLLIVGGDDRNVLELNRRGGRACSAARQRARRRARRRPSVRGARRARAGRRAGRRLVLAPPRHGRRATPAARPARGPVDAVHRAGCKRASPRPRGAARSTGAAARPRSAARARSATLGSSCSARPRTARTSSTAQRALITKRLIEEKGFDAVAVEADWPDAYRVNRLRPGRRRRRRRRAGARGASSASRPGCGATPTCSISSAGCARTTTTPGAGAVGFYGLDLYSLYRSIEAVIEYLDEDRSRGRASARGERYACFERFDESQAYGHAVASGRLRAVRPRGRRAAARAAARPATPTCAATGSRPRTSSSTPSRTRGSWSTPRSTTARCSTAPAASWNLRDRHMAETARRAARPPRPPATRAADRRVGAQLARRRRQAHRDVARAASSTSASWPASATATTPS